jgi:hypothetical protein
MTDGSETPRHIAEMVGAIRRCAYSTQNWVDYCKAEGRSIGDREADIVLAHCAADYLTILLTPEV